MARPMTLKYFFLPVIPVIRRWEAKVYGPFVSPITKKDRQDL